MNFNPLKKQMLAAVVTLSTASMYFAQSSDTLGKEKDIEQVVLTGVADIAKDRKTPVAVSTIKEAHIVERLGNQEFPEILATTPSVYATKGGGGFGDGRMVIRGFQTENIAVMINGIPVNDMENGAVYWSNWIGLSDVTSAMQVQRGLGSSKLAIASVGGTVNILTRAADKKREGNVTIGVGNDGYHKALFSYNTGLSKNGWSSSFLMSRASGSTYIDGSNFEGYNYYFALGYKPNDKHDLQFTLTGAPQWHNQNFTNSIATYLQYGENGRPNRRYNSNWGYLNGREFSTNTNFYSKPIMSINWDWTMNSKSKLSTALYGSWGRGGGTGMLGSINGKNAFDATFKNADGQFRWDDIVTWNQGGTVASFGANNAFPAGNLVNRSNNGLTRRANINSHDWYGILSNFNHKINNEWNFSVGVDGRYYYGYHPGVITDFLGANAYQERGNANITGGYLVTESQQASPSANPWAAAVKNKSQIANRNYDGEVRWLGTFGQLEYSNNNISAFVQGSVSNQGFQRIDNWIIDGVTVQNGQIVNTKTGFKNLWGFNVKSGLNYNINSNHNVFGNVGYYERQPFLTAVFPNNRQVVNPFLTNEKIFSAELGYGYRSSNLNANLNLYRTSWKDRSQRRTLNNILYDQAGVLIPQAFAELNGITQIHTGIEFDATYRLGNYLNIDAMLSYGDFRYSGNANGYIYDDTNAPITMQGGNNQVTLALDKAKVGDAAQMTAALGATIKPAKGFSFNAIWRYVDKLYSQIDINSFMLNPITGEKPAAAELGTLRLPNYNLFDLGASYTFKLSDKQSLTFRGNVYNLLDTIYISEGRTSFYNDATNTASYNGIDVRNQVYFGFGRTWAASVSFKF